MPGANGSTWVVDAWLRYSGSGHPRILPLPFCYSPVPCLTLSGKLDPGWGAIPFEGAGDFVPMPFGVLIHFDSRYAADVTFAARVRDVSRALESAGTEVPVLHEDRITAERLALLNVPIAPQYRNALRVYALPDIQQPEVEVRYFRQTEVGSGTSTDVILLRQERVRLTNEKRFPEWSLHPAFHMVGNFQLFPELADENAIWMEVVPVTPVLRIWAMVSVTNNETQQVTLITPGAR